VATSIRLANNDGDSVEAGGGVEGAVGHKNPLPITKDYTTAIEYDVNGNAIYVGHAMPGTAKSAVGWRIKKITYDGSGNATDIKFASNSKQFLFIWDSRSGYSYG